MYAAERRRIYPAVFVARLAPRFHAYSPLWIFGQSYPGEKTEPDSSMLGTPGRGASGHPGCPCRPTATGLYVPEMSTGANDSLRMEDTAGTTETDDENVPLTRA